METDEKIVSTGDFVFCDSGNSILRTFALGSCVACVIYDRETRHGGMVHVALPDSSVNKLKAKEHPGYFADTGVAQLWKNFKESEEERDPDRIDVYIAGGAEMSKKSSFFNIGASNVNAVKKAVEKCDLCITAQHTGNSLSRSLSINLETGILTLFNPIYGSWTL